jgi:hypothetical protein
VRFRPPENALIITNPPAAQPLTNAIAGGNHPPHHPHSDGGPPTLRTVYVLSGTGKDATLEAVQVKTGITDGIYTEVVSGLNDGDKIVTGSFSLAGGSSPAGNPFGGGFPRMR